MDSIHWPCISTYIYIYHSIACSRHEKHAGHYIFCIGRLPWLHYTYCTTWMGSRRVTPTAGHFLDVDSARVLQVMNETWCMGTFLSFFIFRLWIPLQSFLCGMWIPAGPPSKHPPFQIDLLKSIIIFVSPLIVKSNTSTVKWCDSFTSCDILMLRERDDKLTRWSMMNVCLCLSSWRTPIGLLGFHRISNVIKKESEFQDHARASWFGDLQFYKRTQLILITIFSSSKNH